MTWDWFRRLAETIFLIKRIRRLDSEGVREQAAASTPEKIKTSAFSA
jgi:hypothetical protein